MQPAFGNHADQSRLKIRPAMTRQSSPLEQHRVIRTHSLDRMREALAHIYARVDLDPVHPRAAFDVEFNNFQLAHTGISFVRYGAAVRLTFPETNLFTQKFPIKGKGEVLVGRSSVVLSASSSEVSSPGTSYRTSFDASYEHLILRLDPKALTQKLVALTGRPLGAPLRITPAQTFESPQGQFFRNFVMFLVNDANAASSLPAAVSAQLEQTLMLLFLNANAHNYREHLEQTPHSVAPWQVRRAEQYIEANWNKPILVEDIADVTGASARSIFRTFKQSRGYSPMAFAKQVRMQHAHRLLKNAGSATKVTDIALASGYGDFGAFSKDYRRAFGELPSDILKRIKGADTEVRRTR